jgi:hypothetical protein
MKYQHKIVVIASAFIFAIGMSAQAFADPIPAPTPSSAWFKLSSHGSTRTHGQSPDVYVGPYGAYMNSDNAFGSTAGLPSIALVCVDFGHRVDTGDVWDAWITPLTGGSLDHTRGGNDALQQYEEAAWLASQFTDGNRNGWVAIHSAIWNILGYNDSSNPFTVNGTQDWINQADTFYEENPNAGLFGGYAIVTPMGDYDEQEFLAPMISTPEPSGLLMLGAGLLGIGFLRRRRQPTKEGSH